MRFIEENGLPDLGAVVEKFTDRWEITGCGGKLAVPEKVLDMGNSGTGLRMLTAAAALAEGKVAFTGDESLCSRGTQIGVAGIQAVNKNLILPPEMPFGGVGNSGFGRENGMDFMYEYTEAKSILFG